MKGVWVPHDTRDQIVDFVNRWSRQTGIGVLSLLLWLGLTEKKTTCVIEGLKGLVLAIDQ